MNATEKIKAAFENLKVVFENTDVKPLEAAASQDVTTSEGLVLTVGGDLLEGVTVSNSDGTPANDAEYQLTDGTIITVVGGVITLVQTAPEMPEETPVMPDMSAKLSEEFEAYKVATALVIETLTATLESYNVELASQRKLIDATFETIKTFADMPQEVEAVEISEKVKMANERKELKASALDRIIAARKSIKVV